MPRICGHPFVVFFAWFACAAECFGPKRLNYELTVRYNLNEAIYKATAKGGYDHE